MAMINNTTTSSGVPASGAFSLSVVHAAGEGLHVHVSREGDYAAPAQVTGVVWDAAGDNQAFTFITSQQSDNLNRWEDIYWLAAPTSTKTGNVTVNFGSGAVDRCGVIVRHVTGHSTSGTVTTAKSGGQMGNTTPISLTPSTNVGDMVILSTIYRNDAQYMIANSGQNNVVRIAINGITSRTMGGSTKVGSAGTTTVGWYSTEPSASVYDYASIASVIPTSTINNPPTFSGTIANINGTGGTAITPVDVHALFSDTDALTYSISPAGTAWPSGLAINSSTGVISGTVATSTTTGLRVRATDTASQTVDSNAFSVTISAPTSTVSSVTVSPSTAMVSGSATQTFTASVIGTNSPSQTVNWSMTGAGSINASTGVYTAPAATSSAQTATITATSAQDGSKSGTATVTVPAATVTTSYVDMGTDACDNAQSGLMPSAGLTAVVFRRDDLSIAKQVITGITTTTGSLVPRFATTFAVGTPVHVVLINATDNTITGIVSDHATVS